MLEVRGLSKRFGRAGILAVDGVSFAAAGGEVFGLLGENGAGKTTTLRMLATVLQPTSGTATVNGHDLVTEATAVRRQIGVVSSEPGVYDRLTPREHLFYFAGLHDLPRAEAGRRADRLISRLGMEEFADRRSAQLSRGMKQKVALARALLTDPPVLLMDEPTAGLDVTSARVVEEFIEESRSAGKSIIFSSHIMSQVEKLCDRVAVIHRGRIVAAGTVTELKSRSLQERFEDVFVRLVGEEA
ncbi:MAG: ABC transporter ATP-binding protein [bacterium]|nr:ABC transporter ATP-binding protein [bacterium]